MALKLDPVRLLIADDVGVGKTVEAGLIARELVDRGEVRRFAVLCPPQIAEQWQAELSAKFHLDAELVLPTLHEPGGVAEICAEFIRPRLGAGGRGEVGVAWAGLRDTEERMTIVGEERQNETRR
jgi:superfamily II DNA or RNA helicase